MKEGWKPKGYEAQIYQKRETISRIISENTGSLLKTARKKTVEKVATVVFLGGTVVSIACGAEFQSPFQSPVIFPTPTSAPTPTPEPTFTPTLVPAPTLEPTRTKIPTPTATRVPTETPTPTPTRTPTPEPTPTPTPTPTPEPTLTPTPIPTPTPEPTPTLTPTPRPTPTPTLTPTPTQVPRIEYKPGMSLKLSKCFTNTSTEYKRRSIDLEFPGGDRKNIKIEVKVDKTQKEIEEEKIKNPDKNVETEKIISEGSVFEIHPGELCADFKVTIRSGADPDCFKSIIYNLRSREGGHELLDQGSFIQNVCIVGTLEGSFVNENNYKYDSTANKVTSFIMIENPADVPQQTKFRIVEPCSFLHVAEREIRDARTDLRISPDQPQTIPANERVFYIVSSTLPFGKTPTFPLKCTVKLDRVPK